MKKQPEPFIRTRELFVCHPNSPYWNQMTPVLKQKHFIPHWTDERVRRHLEMLQAFGFNSLQFTANPASAVYAGVDPQLWRTRLVAMLRTARELGMSVAQFVWGNAVCDQQGGEWDIAYRALDWHKPTDRARLEAWYRDQAELAPYVDRVITHWSDPGGPVCKQCTIEAAIEMHNHILAIFRAAKPEIRGAFSVWYLGTADEWCEGRWHGYAGPVPLAAHRSLDPQTDIVVGSEHRMAVGIDPGRRMSAAEAAEIIRTCAGSRVSAADMDAIRQTGRQMAIWGWYTADMEIEPALHVRTNILQDYFRNLPPQTHTGVAWHSLDDNCVGLNMQNLYVAGQLMQNLALDAQHLLDEFAEGFVGKSNAKPFAAALRAIEQTRTRSRCFDYSGAGLDPADRAPAEQRATTQLPPHWLNDSTTLVAAALDGLTTVRLGTGFKPAWPVTLAPGEYLGELEAHLKSIQQMLAFLQGVEYFKALQRRGVPAAQLTAALHALPPVVYDPAHTAGLEANVYREKLAALKKTLTVK